MKVKETIKILTLIFLIILFGKNSKVGAESTDIVNESGEITYEGKIIEILEEKPNPNGGLYQKLKVIIHSADFENKEITVENGYGEIPSSQKYRKGDTVVLMKFTDSSGEQTFYITDYVRRSHLLSLFVIFLTLSLIVAGKRGFTSFIGMVITFLIIFNLVLPKIFSGSNPIFIIILFSIIVIPITFYLSHGFNLKTNVAIAGTFLSLIITTILSLIYVNSAKITGFTTDEASFLQIMKEGTINMRGIFLAGIIIGFLGVLDDITVSQSAIVFQLKEANKRYGFSELYKMSMDIGKDHISSMINTLILVYTGASLPLLLLFINSSKGFNEVVNYEIISAEIIRTLLGSIGLIIAVPITTVIAASVADLIKGGEKS